jgi:LysM repeat protein
MEQKRVPTICLLFFLCAAAVVGETCYTMEEGDTLYSLSRRYGVSVDLILEYNAIVDPTRIRVGTVVRIPTETYTVQPGEYPWGIAAKLGVDALELLEANDLDLDDVVYPGDVLVVPRRRSVVAETSSEDVSIGLQSSVAEDTAAADASSGRRGTSGEIAEGTSGDLLWPHPGERESWGEQFRGVAIQAELGDEFRSVSSGTVRFVTPFNNLGRVILIRSSGGYQYLYAGADRVDVSIGDEVSVGQVLGSIGVSPAFEAAKVLFSVYLNNRYVDPEEAPRG